MPQGSLGGSVLRALYLPCSMSVSCCHAHGIISHLLSICFPFFCQFNLAELQPGVALAVPCEMPADAYWLQPFCIFMECVISSVCQRSRSALACSGHITAVAEECDGNYQAMDSCCAENHFWSSAAQMARQFLSTFFQHTEELAVMACRVFPQTQYRLCKVINLCLNTNTSKIMTILCRKLNFFVSTF